MLLAVVASAGFLAIARALKRPAFDKADAAIELFIHRHMDSPIGDVWAKTASFIGSNYFLWPDDHRGRHARGVPAQSGRGGRAGRRCDLRDRRRPDPEGDVRARAAQLFDKIALPHDYSFPSGHSMSAMGVWGVIAAVLIALYPELKREIVALAVLLIASIGLSRIYSACTGRSTSPVASSAGFRHSWSAST